MSIFLHPVAVLADAFSWIAWWFEDEYARQGQGLDAAVEWTSPWPPWLTALIAVSMVLVVSAVYTREFFAPRPLPGVPLPAWFVRFALATLRCLAMLILLFMLYELVVTPYRTDLPDIAIGLDGSRSMAVSDEPTPSAKADADEGAVRSNSSARDNEPGDPLPTETRLSLAKASLLQNDARLWRKLAQNYRPKLYSLGSDGQRLLEQPGEDREVLQSFEADQSVSRLGDSVRGMLRMQQGRPTAAAILFTDGINTEGPDLAEAARYAKRRGIPLYIVAIGSDQGVRDLELSNLIAPEVAFAGDLVHFDFEFKSEGLKGRTAVLTLRRSGEADPITTKQIALTAEIRKLRLVDQPSLEGETSYEIEVRLADVKQNGTTGESLEVNLQNNLLTHTIDVRSDQLKVLYVQGYPNYEFRFLKNLLSRGRRPDSPAPAMHGRTGAFELATVLQEADPEYATQESTALRGFPVRREELLEYDVIILGDVNPAFFSESVLTHLQKFVTEDGRGMVMVAGPRHTPHAFRDTPLEPLFPAAGATMLPPDPFAKQVEPFRLQLTRIGATSAHLQLDESLSRSLAIWREVPEQYWFFRLGELKPGVRVLAEHPTAHHARGQPYPLITSQYVGAGQVVFHAVDETSRWRWRRSDDIFGRYWIQTLRFLARSRLQGTRGSVELSTDRREYAPGNPVQLRVRFRNPSLAPASDRGVVVALEHRQGRRRSIPLNRVRSERGVFETVVDGLPAGDYRAWVSQGMPDDKMETPSPTESGPGKATGGSDELSPAAVAGEPGAVPAVQFEVLPLDVELDRLVVDRRQLRRVAEESGGKLYNVDEVAKLIGELPRGKQVRVEAVASVPLWNSWKLALLFIGLLTTEWVLRKRVGLM